MTKKEVDGVISRELRHIEDTKRKIARLKDEIATLRFDIKATRNAIRFWKAQRKTAK